MKKAVAMILLICMLFSTVYGSAALSLPEYSEADDQKIITNATLDQKFTPDKVIVSLKKNYSKVNQKHSLNAFGKVEIETIEDLTDSPDPEKSEALTNKKEFRQILCLTLKNKGKEQVLTAIKELEKLPMVRSAQPNYIITMDNTYQTDRVIVPDDDEYTSQYAHAKLQSQDVWNFTTGSSSILVGVLDSGIDTSHEDLAANVNTTLCRNFTDDNGGNTSYVGGHGTHVAGIIGAIGNNGKGVAGLCWNVKLVSLRIFKQKPDDNKKLITTTDWTMEAINFARNNGIPIINCSFSGSVNDDDVSDAFSNYNGLAVCSAGNGVDHDNNENTPNIPVNTDQTPYYPASYTYSNIISVASTNSNDVLASTSNYGAVSVDLAAPGVGILSTVPNDSYEEYSGTSMAAPMVTGVAALLKSYKPSLTVAQIKSAILNGVTTKSNLSGKCATGGVLNAYGALLEVTGNLKNYDVEIGVNATDKITTMFVNLNFNSSVFFPTAYGHGSAANTYDAVGDSVAGRLTYYYSNSSKPSPGGVLGWAKLSAPQSLSPARNGLTISKVTSSPSTANAYLVSRLIGDVNNDDNINSTDVLYINQYLSGTRTLSSDQIKRGDVNFDGKVDVTDMLLLNQYNVELVRTFW